MNQKQGPCLSADADTESGLPRWLNGNESSCNTGNGGDAGLIPGSVGKSRWRREWLPTPVLLSGESQGQRKLVGYGPWGHKESDSIELLKTHTHPPTLNNEAGGETPTHPPTTPRELLELHLHSGKGEVKVAQSCPTPRDPMDYTVHGILQARILKWVAFPFSRGSSQLRD